MMRNKRNIHIYITPSKQEIVFRNVDEFLYWFWLWEDFGRFLRGMGKQQSWPICQRRRQVMSRPMAFKEPRQNWKWLINFMLYKFLKKCNLIGSKRKYVAFTGSMLKSLGLININRDLLTSSKTRRVTGSTKQYNMPFWDENMWSLWRMARVVWMLYTFVIFQHLWCLYVSL